MMGQGVEGVEGGRGAVFLRQGAEEGDGGEVLVEPLALVEVEGEVAVELVLLLSLLL